MFNQPLKGKTMKTWMKRTIAAVLGTGLLVGGLSACSHRHERHAMTAEESVVVRAKVVERVAKKMDLDAAQKQKLAVLGEQLEVQRQALAGNQLDPREAMKALVAGPRFDRTAAEALVTSKLDVLRAGHPAVLTAVADFYDSLRPEQQQKLRERMDGRSRWSRFG